MNVLFACNLCLASVLVLQSGALGDAALRETREEPMKNNLDYTWKDDAPIDACE